MAHPVLQAINAALERNQEDGFRPHLGASQIGRSCDRRVWYGFRWATRVYHAAKQLRLFNRGHLEEDRFIGWLRDAGITVYPLDIQTGKQWRVSASGGHFGGSLDGIATNVPGVEQFGLTADDPVLLEFKTHGDKSFNKLIAEGVKKSKPEHYIQMQIYMKLRRLVLAVYMAINKNTDEMHVEFVRYDATAAEQSLLRADHIIHSAFPPKRLSEDPSWFECRYCDHRAVCHLREALHRNCRTCVHSKPNNNGEWHCNRWNNVIPLDVQKEGCPDYKSIGDK